MYCTVNGWVDGSTSVRHAKFPPKREPQATQAVRLASYIYLPTCASSEISKATLMYKKHIKKH